MDVSIIYVNYKTKHLVLNSINSVRRWATGLLYEIIIVDNESSDGLVEEINSIYPDVVVIEAGENLGFGRANNLGIKVAKGEVVLFLNPDTLLVNNAVKILFDYLHGDRNAGACGGNLLSEDMQPNVSFGRLFPSFTEEILSIFYLRPLLLRESKSGYFNYTGKPMQVASIVGADLMVKRDVLNITGYFYPDFFMNYEETELCYRIKKAGYKIVSVPDARIIHLEGKSDYVSQSRQQLFFDGKYVYFKRINGDVGVCIVNKIISFKCRLRIAQFRLLNNETKIEYWKQMLQINRNAYYKVKSNG